MTIPAVKSKADELKMIVQDEYWDKASIMELERMRKSIRDLMKFAKSEGEAIHYTEFEDTWTERTEGVEFDNSEDFEDYEKKVNSYLTTHADTLPIYKLRHNQPLTAGDYEMLSKIFTEELGTQEDYDRTFQDTTLGKLVRRIVKWIMTRLCSFSQNILMSISGIVNRLLSLEILLLMLRSTDT